jgi:NhaP-type Na+/H+ or K+/H+ antiporter
LRDTGSSIRKLVTVGALVTWTLTALAARYILGLEWVAAVLLGAILIVTGPTVIGPLLRFVRPSERVSNVLRWEGILIDPVGATLALLVFEYALAASPTEATTGAVVGFSLTLGVGLGVGLLAAGLVYIMIRRYWVPDYMQNAFTLMVVIGSFAVSDILQHESGLLTVTVMGIALTNQRQVTVKHIIQFKEDVGVLLIASLFILLSARLELADLATLGWESILFIAVLMLVVRPMAVLVSTFRSRLKLNERLFIAWMAPRGIVAAAVSSIFALRLADAGYAAAERLVPLVFAVIVVTVAIYGLTALPVARWLKISPQKPPQGVLIVGAHRWAIEMATALKEAGFKILLVDTNYTHVVDAHLAELEAQHGTILSERNSERLNLEGIGRLMALTSNDEVNAMAMLQYHETFERAELYQLPPQRDNEIVSTNVPLHLRGRFLFHENADYNRINTLVESGATVKATPLTSDFTYADYRSMYGERALPLFLVDMTKQTLSVFATDKPLNPAAGQTIISLLAPIEALPETVAAAKEVESVPQP